MGDWLGSKPRGEKACPVSCTEIRRRLRRLVPTCPCAQQRCSVWGHLGWGCAALGLKGCSSLLLQMGKANSLHSRDISARVSRALSAASAAIPLCLPVDFGSASELPWSLCRCAVWAVSSAGRDAEGSWECWAPAQAAGVPRESGSRENHAGKPQPTRTRSLLLLARSSEKSCEPRAGARGLPGWLGKTVYHAAFR